ncbi:MAG: HdeD family acid-resistance protein [Leptolyngbya sp. BL-A-14]
MSTGISTNNDIKSNLNGSIVVSVLLILLGIAAIAFPFFSTLAAESWIAWIILFSGISKLVYTFQTREQGGFIWQLLLSLLYIGTAVLLFVYPLQGILTLTLALGAFLLTEGVFEIVYAFQRRSQPNWVWSLANGITTLVLGGLIWFEWPFNGPFAIGLLVGISIIFTGVSRIFLALAARSSLNQSGGQPQAS